MHAGGGLDDQVHVRVARVCVDGKSVIIVRAAVADLGVAQVFDFMVADTLAQGQLVEVLPEYAAAGPDVHALTVAGQRKTSRVRVFLDFLSEVGTRLPAG